jgi:hypothetical protein
MTTRILPFITIESEHEMASPPKALRKERLPVTGGTQAYGDAFGLEEISEMGHTSSSPSPSQNRTRTSTTPNELEMSQPPSPSRAADVMPNLKRLIS